MNFPLKNVTMALAGAAALAFATPASAELVNLGTFTGTDCSGTGGFPNCWATQDGVFQGPVTDPLGSPSVFKWNNGEDGTETSPTFPTIDGSEFWLDVEGSILSFLYTPGEGDPDLHYFSVKQANGYVLFYDSNPILEGEVDLAELFPDNVGWSHVTWFDTGSNEVPEPGTWAMMLLGFGATGFALRRRRKPVLAQVA